MHHHLTKEEKQAYILADNRLAELAGWDQQVLALEFQDLADQSFPLELTGFDTAQIEMGIKDAEESSPEATIDRNDDIPSVETTAVSRTGDLWDLGRHKLLCGDARHPSAYERLLGASQAAVVFTDPPWNLSITKHVSRNGAHGEFAMASGDMADGEYDEFLNQTLQATKTVCRDGAIVFVCVDWRHMIEFVTVGRARELELKNVCVWVKTNAGMGSFYRSKHELVLVWRVGTASHINTFGLGDTGRYRTNVWTYAGLNAFKAERADELSYHPTVKPVALVADALRDVSHRRDLVLDPFAARARP